MIGIPTNVIQKAMVNSVEKLQEIGKENAILAYLKKRKTKKMPSMIIDSFQFKMPTVNGFMVKGVIFTDAPHAIYVDEKGWKTKKGHKKGYEFMAAGAQIVKKEAYKTTMAEFRKVLGG